MQLVFKTTVLGTIDDDGNDGPAVWADFKPNKAAKKFMKMWRFAEADEGRNDPPVPPEQFDDENWFVIDDAGKLRPIFLPAVYSNGTIVWHWRD